MVGLPIIPAYCERCDAIFGPKWAIPLEGLEKNLNVPEEGFPCPHCGERADVLHGIYDVIGDAIRLLAAREHRVEELEQLADILRNSRKMAYSRSQTLRLIEVDIPGLSQSLRILLPEPTLRFRAVSSLLLQILYEVLTQNHSRPFCIDVNITPYVTVLIEKLVRSRPWEVPFVHGT